MDYFVSSFKEGISILPTQSLQATVPSHVTSSTNKDTRAEHSQHVTRSLASTQFFLQNFLAVSSRRVLLLAADKTQWVTNCVTILSTATKPRGYVFLFSLSTA
jgi:hypothetical protein